MKHTWIIALSVLLSAGMLSLAIAQQPSMQWSIPAATTAACGTSPSPTYSASVCLTVAGPMYTIDGGTTWHTMIGSTGPTGATGATGPQGIQGATGPVWSNCPSATLSATTGLTVNPLTCR